MKGFKFELKFREEGCMGYYNNPKLYYNLLSADDVPSQDTVRDWIIRALEMCGCELEGEINFERKVMTKNDIIHLMDEWPINQPFDIYIIVE